LQLRTKRILAAALFAITWIASVAFGMRVLFHYENAPGSVGAISEAWPAAQIERATDRPTLVMLAHPHCPCTAASIGELAQIMARLEGKVGAYVVFVRPKGAASDWEDTDLRRSAEAIPGVKVVCDPDGVEAHRFGADGRLLFSGGITASRGHAGYNAGESAIVSLVNNQAPVRAQTSVFGGSLAHREEAQLTALCLK
jgi:hypothetical protein